MLWNDLLTPFWRAVGGLLAVAWLAGCAAVPSSPAGVAVRRDALDDFSIEGRFALRHEDHNYSGRLSWRHSGAADELRPDQIDEAIRRIATHDYSIDERMIAHVDVWLPGATKPIEDWALNDITLERADRGKMVELSIRVDDVEMNSFGADGVIVSTPTGSTAYAFSAGGPVMWPNVKALQLIPLAAHALFARPLIIGSGSTFTIDILDDSMSEGWICCDGRRQRALPQGTRVMVRESRDTLRLARLSGVPFTNRLVSKFDLPVVGWREHARNEASSQSLHHGHTFPAAAYAAGVAVAGDAGVAGTGPDKPGERDGKAGS